MKKPFFAIVVVAYNAGDKLIETVRSITSQSFEDYTVLIKDGMSTDGSIEKLKSTFDVAMAGEDAEKKITLLESCDNGIYHAMNIATAYLKERSTPIHAGESPSYIFFLNCGDYFRDRYVLEKVHAFINKRNMREGTTLPAIYYGDIFDSLSKNRVASNPKIDDYACYRHVPWHQACFYDERLIYRNPFDLQYRVRADYEQFLKCFYKEKADTVYMPVVVANYEGGGFSDKNKKISEEERRRIIKMYLPASKIRKYDFLRVVTLTHVRAFFATNKATAALYNGIKTAIYDVRGKRNKKE